MMDLKEIIKWFIPCFHILRVRTAILTHNMTVLIMLFLLLNLRSVSSANLELSKYNNYDYMEDNNEIEESSYFNDTQYDDKAKNVEDYHDNNQEDYPEKQTENYPSRYEEDYDDKAIGDDSDDYDNFNYNRYDNDIYGVDYTTEKSLPVRSGKGIFGNRLGFLFGRTFGRPFKKLAAALIPLAFQIGAASTWAVIAALVGVKTLAIALLILKLILLAGAAKFGSFFGQKVPASGGWEAPHPHKEIHLHIHNGQALQHGHEVDWNRDGAALAAESNNVNLVVEPYGGHAGHGPQTISTPYGHYLKLKPHHQNHHGVGSSYL